MKCKVAFSALGVLLPNNNLGYSPLLVGSIAHVNAEYVMNNKQRFYTTTEDDRCKVARPSSLFQTKLSCSVSYKITLTAVTPKAIPILRYSLFREKGNRGGWGIGGWREGAVEHVKFDVYSFYSYASFKPSIVFLCFSRFTFFLSWNAGKLRKP